MLLTPVAARLSVRFGKREIFLVALGWGVIRSALLWFLLDPAHPWLLLVNSALAGFDGAAIFMLCHAMISDICDLDELQSGQRREGLFGALYGWVYKTGNALSLLGVGSMLLAIGFKTSSGGEALAQAPQTLFLLKLSYCLIPMIAFSLGLLLMRKYELTRASAERIRAALDARAPRHPENC
jgi:GPH family glycoside/pentoside/hexuronide:cation symporter